MNKSLKKKRKILIIEDEKVLRDLIEERFTQRGFEVFASIDGDDGFQKIIKLKPDLIFLDIILPGKSGFDILKDLKVALKKDFNKLKIIILSNLGQEDDINKAKAFGVLDYLIKANITVSDIEKKARKYLSL